LSNVEKLRMVEEAVGLEPFRENVILAQQKLTRILSQSESVSKLLESAEQTLKYWREQYEKYQEKKQLQTKRRFLERELSWAEVERRENNVKELENDKNKMQDSLKQIEREKQTQTEQLQRQREQMEILKRQTITTFEMRINVEHEIAAKMAQISMSEGFIEEAKILEDTIQTIKADVNIKFLKVERLNELVKISHEQLTKLHEKVREIQTDNKNLEKISDETINQILENKIQLALLEYRKENYLKDAKKLENAMKTARISLDSVVSKALEFGTRIASTKTVNGIQDEIRIADGHLAALAGVSEDIERQYESYSKLFLELKEKAQTVAENRQKALDEVSTRMQSWRNVMQSLLDRVNWEYQKILEKTKATGEVRLSDGQDIEAAGLEILVGFKGGKPVALNAYTQSGGERTTATMSFLLALQHHVRSPLRAVDEYDIHMDPRNREMIAKILISTIKDANAQYIVITPSQVTFAQENANIVTVQNVEGKSFVREVK
jgi:structural maintenance of chromosomes protein 5